MKKIPVSMRNYILMILDTVLYTNAKIKRQKNRRHIQINQNFIPAKAGPDGFESGFGCFG